MTVTQGDNVEFIELPGRRSGDPLRSVKTASSMRVVKLQRSPRRLAHRHPLSEEVVYVRRGNGAVYIDGVWKLIGPGDTVHIPQTAVHATVPNQGEEMELVCFFPHPQLTDNIEETDIDVMVQNDE